MVAAVPAGTRFAEQLTMTKRGKQVAALEKRLRLVRDTITPLSSSQLADVVGGEGCGWYTRCAKMVAKK